MFKSKLRKQGISENAMSKPVGKSQLEGNEHGLPSKGGKY